MPDDQGATIPSGPPAEKTFASGRYVVRRVLGEGGQKVVYLVDDTALGRQCALSVLKAADLKPAELSRLRREAQAMASLGAHPNIVSVFDIGDDEGRPYLICEYVPAGDLRRALRDAGGPLAIERALALAQDLCRALVAAHSRGVFHRDLKPANVWLAEDGGAKLGDFGLATALDRSRVTMTGAMLGTAAYMPPEQALGGAVDARSDLYALGCVLYELVAGRPPFVGDSPLAVISQHASSPPGPPSQVNTAVPLELDELILQLLAKAPQDRPESAAQVEETLAMMNPAQTPLKRPRPRPRAAPRVQYVRTSDDVRIAYCMFGEGKGLVKVPPVPVSHVQLVWQNFQPIYAQLADSFHQVWYDHRGCGMSQRDRVDFSIEAMLRDLSAVVDRQGSDPCVLVGFSTGVPIAVAYAALCPERVSHLVLVDGFATAADAFASPGFQAERALRGLDWTIYTDAFARSIVGYRSEFAEAMSKYIRAAVEPETNRAAYSAIEEYDVSADLPQLRVPTLVVWNKTNRWTPMPAAQRLAGDIAGAEFVIVDDLTYHEELPSRIREFVLQDS